MHDVLHLPMGHYEDIKDVQVTRQDANGNKDGFDFHVCIRIYVIYVVTALIMVRSTDDNMILIG